MNNYIVELDPVSLSQIRWSTINEAERMRLELKGGGFQGNDAEQYNKIITSMMKFADFLGNVASDLVQPFSLVDTYLLLLSSNKKEESEKVLESIWCSMTEEQKQTVIKKIEKK